jgi:RNA polymerase sigma-70 factor (ECF subfamily)
MPPLGSFDVMCEVGANGSTRLEKKSTPSNQDNDDRALFDEVFVPHMTEGYRLARSLTGNGYDAEDVLQDAALRAFRAIKQFTNVNARAWSMTIVRHTAYDWLRKNRSKRVTSTDDLSAKELQEMEKGSVQRRGVVTPEEIVLSKANAEAVQRALTLMPAKSREVVILRDINQMNYRNIAEIIDVPVGTVMSRLHRARQLLFDVLQSEGEGDHRAETTVLSGEDGEIAR